MLLKSDFTNFTGPTGLVVAVVIDITIKSYRALVVDLLNQPLKTHVLQSSETCGTSLSVGN